MLDEQELAALALTSRLVDSGVKALSSREYWALSRDIEPSTLLGKSADELATECAIPDDHSVRIARLLDRAAGIAFAIERLDHAGIWTITGAGPRYPERLRARLGDAAPAVLHGVGDGDLLGTDGVGVVGSRNAAEDGLRIAREIARAVAKSGRPVVSGAARGVDATAMDATVQGEGRVVGVLADPLDRVVDGRGIRRGVAGGRICLITPYPPSAPFSAGNAVGRNKIIYGLSRCTVVVASERGSGGTWAGAMESLENGYGRVAAWTGAGSGSGNRALVGAGAAEFADVERIDELLESADSAARVDTDTAGDQLGFDL